MTAATMESDKKATQSVGMNDFVSKPIDINELTTVLLRWIYQKKQNDTIQINLNDGYGVPFIVPGLNLSEAVIRLDNDWNLN